MCINKRFEFMHFDKCSVWYTIPGCAEDQRLTRTGLKEREVDHLIHQLLLFNKLEQDWVRASGVFKGTDKIKKKRFSYYHGALQD